MFTQVPHHIRFVPNFKFFPPLSPHKVLNTSHGERTFWKREVTEYISKLVLLRGIIEEEWLFWGYHATCDTKFWLIFFPANKSSIFVTCHLPIEASQEGIDVSGFWRDEFLLFSPAKYRWESLTGRWQLLVDISPNFSHTRKIPFSWSINGIPKDRCNGVMWVLKMTMSIKVTLHF